MVKMLVRSGVVWQALRRLDVQSNRLRRVTCVEALPQLEEVGRPLMIDCF
jgi:hypothetical protein